MPTYQPNIPTGTVPFNQDYANVQGNFQVADTSFGKDHYAFSDASANNGYHKVAHLVAISTVASNPPNNFPIVPPATVGFTGELFTTQTNDAINTDEVLWWQTGGGKIAQLTRNFNPITTASGATFLPGGMIYQWGTAVSTGASPNLSVIFPQTFTSTNFFGVQINVLENSSSRRIWHLDTLSASGFTAYIQDINGTSVANTIYWMAIGK